MTRENNGARQTLVQSGFAGFDAEVMKLDLRLGPGERRRPRVGRSVPMLVDATQQRRARFRRHGPECDVNRGPRRYGEATTQGEDRVKHGPDGIGQRSRAQHGDRRAHAMSATKEAPSIGFELRRPDRFAFGDAQMSGPDFGLRRRALSPGCEDRSEIAKIFSFDEKLCEGGMRNIGALRSKREFAIGVISMSRVRLPPLAMVTRRTSASSSAETSTSSVVVRVPSRRVIWARSSLNSTEYSSPE